MRGPYGKLWTMDQVFFPSFLNGERTKGKDKE